MCFKGIDDNNFAIIVIATLVEKLGGHVKITQAELDAIAYKTITEDLEEQVYELRVHTRTKQ